MKERRKRDILIPEVQSNEIDNVDTYAQWDRSHYFINITPPKPKYGVTVSSKPDKVTSGQDASIIVDYTTKYYDTTGELNQNVLIGSAMKNVVINASSDKKMLPSSSASGTRPSGIVFTNSDRVSLTISGTPTSDDDIVIDPPVDKRCCVVVPVPNVGYEITADPTIVDELGTNNTAWFASKFNLIIRPDSGHEFVDENVVVSPKSMKDAIVGSFNKTMIRLEWDEVHGMPLSDFTIQAPAVKLSGYKVTINVPKGVERESGGELIQDVTIGQEMTQVNLVAIKDLTTVNGFLPADHNTNKDGISVNVDTSGNAPYKKAWVTGTPLRATTIDIVPLVVGYAVNITGGAHTTHVSGSLHQFVKAGQSIETVIFRCNEGYWFGKYSGGSNNSMSVDLNDTKTEITLSGRPASMDGFGDFDVKLEDAVPKPVALTVNLPSDGSVIVKPGEEANLNQSVASGENIQGITLLPKNANYKMTQDWRKTITVEPANEHISIVTTDTETHISGRISENSVITVPALIGGGIVLHSDTFSGLTSYEGRWWTEWQLSNVSDGAVIKYIKNILTETGPKNIVLYTDEASNNSYFTNIPYGLSERFTIQFNETKKIPMIWRYSDSKKGYYADLDYDMFCIDIGEDSYNNMSKPCTVRYWSRPYWYKLSLPASVVVNGDPVKLTLTCYGDTTMFDSNKAVIGINPSLTSSLQVHTVTPFVDSSSNTYEATIKFTSTRDYTFSEDIVYVIHLDEVATVGIQLLYSGSV